MIESPKTIGICAHSYEGGALCFLSTCREGVALLGPHMHPNIVLSAIPMGLSMPSWEMGNYDEIAKHLHDGINQVAQSGADFFICPDNTAHLVLEKIVQDLPIPGLHIADVVCQEIVKSGWKNVALLGTKWTMTGTVYSNALEKNNLNRMIPAPSVRTRINNFIFEELCQGVFHQKTIAFFLDTIETLKQDGAECVILGCTEIPLIITMANSSIPILDSTRLLSKNAVALALSENSFEDHGWISPI